MVNTQMLDRLMKPIIEEDLKRERISKEREALNEAELKRGYMNKNIWYIELDQDVKEILDKYYNINFAKEIRYNASHDKFSQTKVFLYVIDCTIQLYEWKFGFNRKDPKYSETVNTPTTMSSILQDCNRKFIKDAFKKDKNHERDFISLLWLKQTLSSWVYSKTGTYYEPNSEYRNKVNNKRNNPDQEFSTTDWAAKEKAYWDDPSKKTYTSRDFFNNKTLEDGRYSKFYNINKVLRRLFFSNGQTYLGGLESILSDLRECKAIMERDMNESVIRQKSGLYRLIFEGGVTHRSPSVIKMDVKELIQGDEWPDRFKKAGTTQEKQKVIEDITRLIELLEEWKESVNNESHKLGQGKSSVNPDQTVQPVQPVQPQSDKIKKIEGLWNTFTYNKKLAPDYKFDFKRFVLTRGTFSADGKDPGLMNGYEGPKKSGTLRSISYTPADFNAWLEAKANGTNGIKSIKDELTSAKGYENKHINRIWNATINSKPA